MKPIEYIEPLERAYTGMKKRLFNPADLGKWFTIGFSAWLAKLGENSGGLNIQVPGGNSKLEQIDPTVWKAKVLEHLGLIIGIASVVLLLSIALGVLFLWLRARGSFVFLDNVARNRARISEPWMEFRREGNSLFVWSLVFGLITGTVMLLILGSIAAVTWVDLIQRQFTFRLFVTLALGLLLFFMVALVAGVINRLLIDFVVPIMMKRRIRTREAWRVFSRLVTGRAGAVALYLLLQFALSLCIGALVLIAGFCTCCCGFVLLLIPVVNATLMLPLTMTLRLFALEFLRQFGDDGDCLSATPPDLPPPSGAPLRVPALPSPGTLPDYSSSP